VRRCAWCGVSRVSGGCALWTTVAAALDAPPARPDRVIRSPSPLPRGVDGPPRPDHAARASADAPTGPPPVVRSESRTTHRRRHPNRRHLNAPARPYVEGDHRK
jgi:hypothetical protein